MYFVPGEPRIAKLCPGEFGNSSPAVSSSGRLRRRPSGPIPMPQNVRGSPCDTGCFEKLPPGGQTDSCHSTSWNRVSVAGQTKQCVQLRPIWPKHVARNSVFASCSRHLEAFSFSVLGFGLAHVLSLFGSSSGSRTDVGRHRQADKAFGASESGKAAAGSPRLLQAGDPLG